MNLINLFTTAQHQLTVAAAAGDVAAVATAVADAFVDAVLPHLLFSSSCINQNIHLCLQRARVPHRHHRLVYR